MSKWAVPAKSKYDVFLTVEAGATIAYCFEV